MSSSDISTLMHSLGGVYRDPSRVTRDSSTLLRSPAGSNLRPSISQLVHNNGDIVPSVLVFSGTVAMTYKGNQYNIPVDIYLPPQYPARPPVCFVRPVSTMMIKENHRHVAPDGQVYMPYLHSWRPHSHTLVELVVMLSSLFGADPPVFAKPPGHRPTQSSPPSTNVFSRFMSAATATATGVVGGSGNGSGSGSSTPTPPYASMPNPPPRYEDISAKRRREAEEAAKRKEEEDARAAAIAKEVEEANRAAEAARRAEEEELRQAQEQERLTTEARRELTNKLQLYLQNYYNESRTLIQTDLRDQTKLESGTKSLHNQLNVLRDQKEELSHHIQTVDERTEQIQSVLSKIDSKQGEGMNGDAAVTSPDELAIPSDVHSRQMLDLSAQNAALTDALYFLDKALVKDTVDLDKHLKYVRRLAKKQFLIRAHLLKIAQVRATMQQQHLR